MARIPPWRRNLWRLWPPRETKPHRIPEEQIRPLAERLGKQRPWLSAQENWLAAERALRQKPWRPWVIRFSGEKERSGWDWADLLLKVSVPVLILGLSTAYSIISASRQEKIAREQRENEVITGFVKGMQPLILEKDLKKSAADAEVRGVARGLTLAALSQVQDPKKKRLIVSFLIDSGLNAKPGNLFSLSEADLFGANLSGTDLSGANLSGTDLSGANLSRTNLSGADLSGTDLSGANLSRTNLSRANLSGGNLGAANLSRTNLSRANLSGGNLSGADLREADLFGANLSGTDLSGANLSGEVFGAYSTLADFSEFEYRKINHLAFNQSWAERARLRRASYLFNQSWAEWAGQGEASYLFLLESYNRRTNLVGANLTFARLRRAKLSRANFYGANLAGADFYGANLVGADLRMANLVRADFRRADLTRAKLVGANVGVYFIGGNRIDDLVLKADFRGAIFKQTICPDGKKTDTGCSAPRARQ